MAFFERVFGFEEDEYDATQSKLLQMSTFEPFSESQIGLWNIIASDEDVAKARTIASSPPSSAGADNNKPFGERCLMSIGGGDAKPIDAGVFHDPSVAQLRDLVQRLTKSLTPYERQTLRVLAAKTHNNDVNPPLISLGHVIGDSRALHSDLQNAQSVMQAASQFNYLEFPSPSSIPENGIADYVHDRTQGPACASACAPGTAYRNYLVKMPTTTAGAEGSQLRDDSEGGATRGQRKTRQLNGLDDITKFISPENPEEYYTVRNGYVESSIERLKALNQRFSTSPDLAEEELIPRLRVGVQQDTQVTDEQAGCKNTKFEEDGKVRWRWIPVEGKHPVKLTQVYCSALSIGYSRVRHVGNDDESPWAPLAKVVLNATYEATLLMAAVHTIKLLRRGELADATCLPRVLLTKVGGGVFANPASWIQQAMRRSVIQMLPYQIPMNIFIVHYGGVEREYLTFPEDVLSSIADKNITATLDESA